MWLHTTATATGAVVTDLGYNMIKSVELQIGGTKIDKHYGRWMLIWSELSKSDDQSSAHDAMVNNKTAAPELYVPLQFFCCRNDGLAMAPCADCKSCNIRQAILTNRC